MATKFTLTHEINCNLDTFWKTFLDKDFNVQLYTGTLGFPEWTILEQTDTDTLATRKVTAHAQDGGARPGRRSCSARTSATWRRAR